MAPLEVRDFQTLLVKSRKSSRRPLSVKKAASQEGCWQEAITRDTWEKLLPEWAAEPPGETHRWQSGSQTQNWKHDGNLERKALDSIIAFLFDIRCFFHALWLACLQGREPRALQKPGFFRFLDGTRTKKMMVLSPVEPEHIRLWAPYWRHHILLRVTSPMKWQERSLFAIVRMGDGLKQYLVYLYSYALINSYMYIQFNSVSNISPICFIKGKEN